jgi:hypothetical protein
VFVSYNNPALVTGLVVEDGVAFAVGLAVFVNVFVAAFTFPANPRLITNITTGKRSDIAVFSQDRFFGFMIFPFFFVR